MNKKKQSWIKKFWTKIKIPVYFILVFIFALILTSLIEDVNEDIELNNGCFSSEGCMCRDICEEIYNITDYNKWIVDSHWGNDECHCITDEGGVQMW